MSGRIVILSDLHLGRPHLAASSPDALRPLWRGASHLVINGDLAEVHHPKHRAIAARQTLRLFDLCELDSVELTILSGNHDPFITDQRHLELADGEVFLTHGDVLHPSVSPWSPVSGRIREAHENAIAQLEPEQRGQLESRLSVSQHASYAEWQLRERIEEEASHPSLLAMLIRPWTLVQVALYWRAFPRLAAAFIEEHAPAARFGIFGHTHRAGCWTINDRVIINTGSFGFPGRPRAVVIDGENLMVHDLSAFGRQYRLLNPPRKSYTLASNRPRVQIARAIEHQEQQAITASDDSVQLSPASPIRR